MSDDNESAQSPATKRAKPPKPPRPSPPSPGGSVLNNSTGSVVSDAGSLTSSDQGSAPPLPERNSKVMPFAPRSSSPLAGPQTASPPSEGSPLHKSESNASVDSIGSAGSTSARRMSFVPPGAFRLPALPPDHHLDDGFDTDTTDGGESSVDGDGDAGGGGGSGANDTSTTSSLGGGEANGGESGGTPAPSSSGSTASSGTGGESSPTAKPPKPTRPSKPKPPPARPPRPVSVNFDEDAPDLPKKRPLRTASPDAAALATAAIAEAVARNHRAASSGSDPPLPEKRTPPPKRQRPVSMAGMVASPFVLASGPPSPMSALAASSGGSGATGMERFTAQRSHSAATLRITKSERSKSNSSLGELRRGTTSSLGPVAGRRKKRALPPPPPKAPRPMSMILSMGKMQDYPELWMAGADEPGLQPSASDGDLVGLVDRPAQPARAGKEAEEVDDEGEETTDVATELVTVKNAAGMDVVKAGSDRALLERLTYEHSVDIEYLHTFLLTYRSFATPMQLLDSVIARYLIEPEGETTPEQYAEFEETVRNPIRLRVINVLKTWLGDHAYDFEDDELVDKLRNFVDNSMEESLGKGTVKRYLSRAVEGKGKRSQLVMPDQVPKPVLGKLEKLSPEEYEKIKILQVDPLEFARQLTLYEFGMYKAIKPRECVNKSWSKSEEEAPNTVAMAKRFNVVSAWVAGQILSAGKSTKARAAVMRKMIEFAERLRSLNNFNGLMEIISGLNNAAIHRLKKTWDALPKSARTSYETLNDLCDSDRNYHVMREVLAGEAPPMTPFLGMWLTDLTFIEDGVPDRLTDGSDYVNFGKLRKIAVVIRGIKLYQDTPYFFEEVPVLQNYIANMEGLSDDESYALSLEYEPRKKKGK